MTIDEVQDAITQWELEYGEDKTHLGIKLKYDSSTHGNITSDAISFVTRVIEGLDHRMPENPQMEALDIFDFTLMPDSQEQWDKVKGTYGDKEIEGLIEHFGQSRQQYTRVAGSRIERLVDPIEVRVE